MNFIECAVLQGKYTELSSQQTVRTLATNSGGVFNVTDPKAAVYTFKKSYKGSECVDAITSESCSHHAWPLLCDTAMPLAPDMPA